MAACPAAGGGRASRQLPRTISFDIRTSLFEPIRRACERLRRTGSVVVLSLRRTRPRGGYRFSKKSFRTGEIVQEELLQSGVNSDARRARLETWRAKSHGLHAKLKESYRKSHSDCMELQKSCANSYGRHANSYRSFAKSHRSCAISYGIYTISYSFRSKSHAAQAWDAAAGRRQASRWDAGAPSMNIPHHPMHSFG